MCIRDSLRNEVQQRAAKGDVLAQRIAAVTKSTTHENISREKILSSMPKVGMPATAPVVGNVTVNVTAERQQTIVQSAMSYASRNQQIVQTLATQNNVSQQHVSSILQTYTRVSVLNTSVTSQITQIAQEVGVEEQQVKQVISQASRLMRSRSDLMDAVARQESVDKQTVDQAVQVQLREAVGVTNDKSNSIVKRVFTQVSACLLYTSRCV